MLEFINKYKWWIVAIIVLIIVIAIIYRYYKNKPNTEQQKDNLEWSVVSTSSGAAGGLTSTKCQQQSTFPLKKGSTGKQVGALQKFINAVPSSNKLTVDCDFGNATENEVFRGIGKKEVDLATYKAYNIIKFES